MSLVDNLKKAIGDIWYVRDHFDVISKHKGVLERARSVEEILETMAKYDPRKKKFSEQVILDNYMGSLQHFLTGYDLSSIHLSSKSMEVAILVNISSPTQEEKKRRQHKTFKGLRLIAIDRKLIKNQKSIEASQRVIDRRNMFVHDAILKQAVEIEQEKWLNDQLEKLPKKMKNTLKPILLFPIRNKLKRWKSLPDLSWYVRSSSYSATRKMIRDFFKTLDEKIEKNLEPMRKVGGKSIITKMRQLPKVIENMKESIYAGETDFIKYCARKNLEDVKIVLDDIYENKLFT